MLDRKIVSHASYLESLSNYVLGVLNFRWEWVQVILGIEVEVDAMIS